MQSARTAIKRLPGSSVTVLDSLNISVGQGLVVAYAARMVKAGKSHDEIVEGINHAREITKIYCCIKDLSYSVRGGRVPRSVKVVADLFKMSPILTTSSKGKMVKDGAVFGKNNLGKKMVKYINKKYDISKAYRISVGHCNCREEGEILINGLKYIFSNLISIELLEVGGALGVHTGPGSLVVGIQEQMDL
jgi:DegV family protein with EDD domain